MKLKVSCYVIHRKLSTSGKYQSIATFSLFQSLPFKGFSSFETEKAGQLLKKKIYEINVKNKSSLKSNPFRCTNVNKISNSIKLPNNSLVLSKTDQTGSNDFKSGNGILRKARLNIASDYKVQDGLFSPSESWVQLNGK
jgi:hypothetical protein